MELINSPFIMKFVRSFKDDYYIYFLLEFVQGIELFDAIREIGLLNVHQTRFYISQMILQLEYLHTNCIIYRDLKPENIMVTSTVTLSDTASLKGLLSACMAAPLLCPAFTRCHLSFYQSRQGGCSIFLLQRI